MRTTNRAIILAILGIAWLHQGYGHAEDKRLLHSFTRQRLTDAFYSEGADFGDFNSDGHNDVISGPYWYAGPDYKQQFEIYPVKPFHIDGYSNNFLTFVHDINGDGWDDVLVVGFPAKEAFWYENPQGGEGHWPQHLIHPAIDNESPMLADVTGDGQPELVFMAGGQLGFAEIPTQDPTQPWTFRGVTPNRGYVTYTHGLGVGDVNGDGKMDLLERTGWWEQPAEGASGGLWTYHPVPFAEAGGAQMFTYDVDDDGDNDVITSKAAHAYGLSWFEHVNENGAIRFREHKVMGEQASENVFGVAFSQLHALALTDMDGDGVLDLVTGKRFWAHAGKDAGGREPAVLYWFQIQRGEDGVRFVPHLIDSNSGVGTQVVVGDVSGDDRPDIVVGNKKGTFVLTQQVEEVDRTTWQAAQPVATYPAAEPSPLVGEPAAQSTQSSETDDASATTEKLPDGVHYALGERGNRLNLGFESGDLSDWTAAGDAFAGQPIRGDTVVQRRADMRSGHGGQFWIGGYELHQDNPVGTLTSAPFEVTHPWASFLAGGGAHERTAIEIVLADGDEVLYTAVGQNNEQMHAVAVDLGRHMGENIYVRLVDEVRGGWGHMNFDQFLFHEVKPETDVVNPQLPRRDQYALAGAPAKEAAAAMILPEGFEAHVFAAEPDVQQPIAMALDDRGRVWIAEAYEYPRRAEGEGRDRILVFEDTDGDHRFDKRTVFAEGLNLVSGLEVGFGGVWVGAAPYLLFIPDRDGDDRPDGEPKVLLDGWGYEDTHETLNSFIWGPDGWLYGCHGVFTHSKVGKPGLPDEARVPLNAAVWRYHPTRHEFEVFAHGTSNPWGVDFDDHGQAFCTACVIPHLFHVIQGARYQRQAGQHFNPHTYDDIVTIADHRHYVGANPHGGNGVSDDAGGGHAHAGAMIYLGGAWPEEYRGQLFMNNIHGQRLNVDSLDRQGSGFIGRHEPDFLLTQDQASQILNLRYGPDGQATMIDWYDMQACHLHDSSAHDRSNGRIYRIVFDGAQSVAVDLSSSTDQQLAKMCLHENDWHVRHSRRILQERAAERVIDEVARQFLVDTALNHEDATRRLRAMWALHAAGLSQWKVLGAQLRDPNPYVRAWVVQLAMDLPEGIHPQLMRRFLTLAEHDESPIVRLYLASAAGRLPLKERWHLVQLLTQHAEDAADHNLPLMYWFAAEPLAQVDPERALAMGMACGDTIPLLREYMIRRVASLDSPDAMAALVREMGGARADAQQLALLKGARTALRGRRRVQPPPEWDDVSDRLLDSEDDEVRAEATALGVTFGDSDAFAKMRAIVDDANAPLDERRRAIETLLSANDPGLARALQAALREQELQSITLRGLAQYADEQTPMAVLNVYASLQADQKRVALATLASRSNYAIKLLNAAAAGEVPVSDLSADLVQQLLRLDDPKVSRLVEEVWGSVRSTPAEKAALIDRYKQLIADPRFASADPRLGRAIFAKTCQQCHTLFGAGHDIGPDLTGSNRDDADYLLSNIVDPGALMAKEYQTTTIVTVDGRTVSGLILLEDEHAVTLRNATDAVTIPNDEIETRRLSTTSIMPDDQLKQFTDGQVSALFAYLRSPTQTTMLATAENAASLFNGRDLAGWQGDPAIWSVEEGQIIGQTQGIDHNSFLISDLEASNFKLTLEVKLVDDQGNSGIQFRSEPMGSYHEVRGYQADIGVDWWGKLYEENGRALLCKESGEQHVRPGEWNRYEIVARGDRVRTWINGGLCVDLVDPEGRKEGVFALQVHSGGPTEVRFRNLKLEMLGD